MLIVFEIAPEMKGYTAAIMRMWLSTDWARRPVRPHGLAQSRTGRCWGLQVGRSFQCHVTTAESVGSVDLGAGEAERRQQLEGGIIQRPARYSEPRVGAAAPTVLSMAASGGFLSFAGARANGEVAPLPDLPGLAQERRDSVPLGNRNPLIRPGRGECPKILRLQCRLI